MIGSAGTAPTALILVELRALKKDFAAVGISLRGESEVKLTVCIADYDRSREAAMIGIGNGRKGRACLRNGPEEAEVRDGDKIGHVDSVDGVSQD